MKTCIKCGESKDLLQFGKNKLCKDGHVGTCKKCVSIYHKEYSKSYKKQSKTKAESTKLWKSLNNKQVKANKVVYAAIRAGRLTRMPCEVCGAAEAEAHHDDYNQPYAVRFLCRKHHAEWHSKFEPIR